MTMAQPSTAEYQKHRKDTLRGVARTRELAVAYELAKENQRKLRKRYRPAVLKALRPL